MAQTQSQVAENNTPVIDFSKYETTSPTADDITSMATKYGLDPSIINRQIQQESGGDQSAVSKKGAIGLMQLMPETAKRLNVDPTDPKQNLDGGMKEMSRLVQKYNGDYHLALAAYNAGEPAVDKVKGIPDYPETQNYVNSIMGSQPSPASVAPQIDFSKYEAVNPNKPSDQDQPSAFSRFAGSMTEAASGLPADIKKWPEVLQKLQQGPYPSYLPMGVHLNMLLNIAKGMVASSSEASKSGMEQFNQPGVINKAAGALKYIIGGIPVAGPSIVKSMNQLENGDYAGGSGTLSGLGLQALMANPETTGSHLTAAGQYLFSKPRVLETMLAGETKDMLTSAEASARAKGHSLFPTSTATVPGFQVSEIANKAIAENIKGTAETPGPLKSMTAEDFYKRLGAIESPGGQLQDIYGRMNSNTPMTMDDLHGFYTELGRYSQRDLPGDVYNTVKQTRDDLGELIGDVYKSDVDPATGELKRNDAGLTTFDQWTDAKAFWHDLATKWWDSDSPLKKAMDAKDPGETLHALLGPNGDSAERSTRYLKSYTDHGADPNVIKAAQTLYKGMNQMTLRGLLQASGGLLLSYLLRSGGMPGTEAIWGASGLIGTRLGLGYFRTRPTLSNLLSQAAERPALGRMLPGFDTGGIGFNTPNPSSPSSPSQTPMEDIIHNSSTVTPAEVKTIQSIGNSPAIPDNVKADIKAITDDLKAVTSKPVKGIPDLDIANMGIMRLKGIMSIMRKQGVSYGEAIKQYDAKGKQ